MKRKLSEEGGKFKVSALAVELKSSAEALFPVKKNPCFGNKFKNTCGLCNRQGAKVLSIFRIWKGRDLFESNLREILGEDGFLNDYFDVKEISFEKDSRQLVYCKNIKGLVKT